MTAHWQRHDHFDPRDPWAPLVFCCTSCDRTRDFERAYCPDCEAVTGSYLGHGRPSGGPYATFDGDKITTREAECLRAFGRKVA